MSTFIGSGLIANGVAAVQNVPLPPVNIVGRTQVTVNALSVHGNHIKVEYSNGDETGPYAPSPTNANVVLAAATAKMFTETVDAVWMQITPLDAGETNLTVSVKSKELR